MNSAAHKHLMATIIVAAFLGSGALVIWWLVVGITFSIIGQWTEAPLAEWLQISPDGEPIIQQFHKRQHGRYHSVTYRTAEGQPITVSSPPPQPAAGASLPAESHGPPQKLLWDQRIASVGNTQNPPDYWYLIRDELPTGYAYFMGYNFESEQLVGYLSRIRFSSEPPSMDDRFSHTEGTDFNAPFQLGQMPRSSSRAVNLISGGQLFEIDLNRRAVRALQLPGQAISFATVYERTDPSTSEFEQRIAVRTKDKIFILDYEQGQALREISIPEKLRDQSFDLYFWWKPTPIFVTDARGWLRYPEVHWVNEQGKITRHEIIHLVTQHAPEPKSMAWMAAGGFLSPSIYAVGAFIVSPLSDVYFDKAPNYSAALAQQWAAAWPAFLALCLLSVVLAAGCYRRHRRYSDRNSTAWAGFVLVAGVPGLVGYLLHRRWPVMERCRKCGKESPRDRDACLFCGAEFPTPAPKGIEIFA